MENKDDVCGGDLTAAEAIEHVAKKVKTTTAAGKTHSQLNRELMDLACTPNVHSADKHFKKCKSIHAVIDGLTASSSVLDDHVMSPAKDAFMKSGHDRDKIARINNAWTKSGETTLKEFMAHHNNKLKLLWESGDCGANKVANEVTKDLIKRLAVIKADMEQVNENVTQVAQLAQGDGSSSKQTGDLSSLTDTNNRLIQKIAQIVINCQSSNGGKANKGSKRATHGGKWR